MSDEDVAELLRSHHQLVVVEAPAGCGKTFQGATYARDTAGRIPGGGRLLILTHTHAACGVFSERTKGASTRVEIRTIDALIGQIATVYHKSLGLPREISSWAWHNNGRGFEIMASKVAVFLKSQPMVVRAVVQRYPVVICDEHQDSSGDQHAVVMALYRGGAVIRIFGDPLQRIYGAKKSGKALRADRERWAALKDEGAYGQLAYPHRWEGGCPALGRWVLSARKCLEMGEPIDLTTERPPSLHVLEGNNIAPNSRGYRLSREQRRPLDRLIRNADQVMLLASQNDLVAAMSGFLGRSIPVWEGHTREALAGLVTVLRDKEGCAEELTKGVVAFVQSCGVGFSNSSHGDRLLQEVREGSTRKATEKVANIQAIARLIRDDPSHVGVSGALRLISQLIQAKAVGFEDVKIDHRTEFKDAIRLGEFANAEDGFVEIARRRTYARLAPPRRVISTIHKAKGLECDNVILIACDAVQFPRTDYGICKLYVALSRAKKSLVLVIPETNPSPLFRV